MEGNEKDMQKHKCKHDSELGPFGIKDIIGRSDKTWVESDISKIIIHQS